MLMSGRLCGSFPKMTVVAASGTCLPLLHVRLIEKWVSQSIGYPSVVLGDRCRFRPPFRLKPPQLRNVLPMEQFGTQLQLTTNHPHSLDAVYNFVW